MLARQSKSLPSFNFEAFRAEEFRRLDAAGIAYLDYTAAALHGASQARDHTARLAAGVFGNPHSEHLASRNSAQVMDAARPRPWPSTTQTLKSTRSASPPTPRRPSSWWPRAIRSGPIADWC